MNLRILRHCAAILLLGAGGVLAGSAATPVEVLSGTFQDVRLIPGGVSLVIRQGSGWQVLTVSDAPRIARGGEKIEITSFTLIGEHHGSYRLSPIELDSRKYLVVEHRFDATSFGGKLTVTHHVTRLSAEGKPEEPSEEEFRTVVERFEQEYSNPWTRLRLSDTDRR